MPKLTALELTKKGMLSKDEVLLIQEIAMELPRKPVVVNIGAGFGTSTMAILEVRPDAFVYSIDKRLRLDEFENLQKAGLFRLNRFVRIMGDSKRVGQDWPLDWMHEKHKKIDLCFVDGAHDDDAVRADIKAWRSKVNYGGFMLFHDYNHPNLPGLSPIVDDMMMAWKEVGQARYLIAFERN